MSAFIHDQLYITLSQITSAQEVIILIAENSDEKTNNLGHLEVLF